MGIEGYSLVIQSYARCYTPLMDYSHKWWG